MVGEPVERIGARRAPCAGRQSAPGGEVAEERDAQGRQTLEISMMVRVPPE